MSIEAEYLLALARGDRAPPHSDGSRPPEWREVHDLAERHQVASLCWWKHRFTLADQEREDWAVPDELLRRLRATYLHHRLRNESLLKDLRDLVSALDGKGIEALFFKGPWVALRAYPDLGARPIGDIDLCVREEDYRAAVAVLIDIGYSAMEALPSDSDSAIERAHYGRQLRFTARGRRPVELHFRMVNVGPPSPPEEWVWSSARDVPIPGGTIRVPGPEPMLLHLLLHANQHAFASLRLLYDIRFALEREGAALDVERIVADAGRLRGRTALYHALLLARDLAGAAVRPDLLGRLRPSAPRRSLYGLAWQLPAVRRLEVRQRRSALESPLLYLLEMGRLRDKLCYVRGMARHAGGVGSLARRAYGNVRSRDT